MRQLTLLQKFIRTFRTPLFHLFELKFVIRIAFWYHQNLYLYLQKDTHAEFCFKTAWKIYWKKLFVEFWARSSKYLRKFRSKKISRKRVFTESQEFQCKKNRMTLKISNTNFRKSTLRKGLWRILITYQSGRLTNIFLLNI